MYFEGLLWADIADEDRHNLRSLLFFEGIYF